MYGYPWCFHISYSTSFHKVIAHHFVRLLNVARCLFKPPAPVNFSFICLTLSDLHSNHDSRFMSKSREGARVVQNFMHDLVVVERMLWFPSLFTFSWLARVARRCLACCLTLSDPHSKRFKIAGGCARRTTWPAARASSNLLSARSLLSHRGSIEDAARDGPYARMVNGR